MAEPAVHLESVSIVYGERAVAVTALDRVTLEFAEGSFTAVMGPSGSGKSTLLQCAAGLLRPTAGRVLIGGVPVSTGTETAVTKFRRQRVGFVFQQFNLIPTLTAAQNVALPLRLAGRRVDRRYCQSLLSRVGMAALAHRWPAELSGGQQQRVAIARAMATDPMVIFADEPTGALDSASASDVLDLLREAVDRHGQTVVMVTHDPAAASSADAVVFLRDGRLAGRLPAPTAEQVATRMAGARGE